MQKSPLFYTNAQRITRLAPANMFVDKQGQVDIQLAMQEQVSAQLLAEAKWVWVAENTAPDLFGAQEILKRLITYQERVNETAACRVKHDIGSLASQYYFYREDYYSELVQYLRNWLAGIVNEGFASRIKRNTL